MGSRPVIWIICSAIFMAISSALFKVSR
jgi:hypothetical protein